MIACYPKFYDDELVYSFLARYFERTGYINYVSAAKDLFDKNTVRPDIEFVNKYTEDAIKMLTKHITFDEVILNHTMFPYYCRFIDSERKKKAFNSLVNMNVDFHKYIPVPKHKGINRYLRYCPLCAEEDRMNYGETYWHRSHQMMGVDICPVHFCNLVNSNVLISGKASPCLVTAEESIDNNLQTAEMSINNTEIDLAKYAYDVFRAPINIDYESKIGDYLNSKLPKRYFDRKMRNLKLITKDLNQYYIGMPYLEDWKIQKIFTGYNTKFNEVCMLAMFLGIDPDDLSNPKPTEVCKKRRNVKKYKSSPGVKAKDWDQIDSKTFPKVRELIAETLSSDKPIRITVGYVERNLGLPPKTMQKLTICKAEVSKHTETQDEFWLRKISWAREVLEETNQPVNWKHIREITNMRKSEFDRLCKM